MSQDQKQFPIAVATAVSVFALGLYAFTHRQKEDNEVMALIGDVGGTNVRLTLRRLDLNTRTSVEIKKLTKIPSQSVGSFEEAVKQFLTEFEGDKSNWPTVAVVGIAGEVKNNVVCTTNCPHWPAADGRALEQLFGIKNFQFLNDFAAAGYGICQLHEKDYIRLNRATPDDDAPKIVMGPGTGLGMGLLVKSQFGKCHEILSTEGGHTDFTVKSEEDWRLKKFAHDYLKNSDNVENLRARGPTERISIERLCAGPAVPLIYEFFKKENPDIKCVLEEGDAAKSPKDITSGDIIRSAMTTKDDLCSKVVEKFAQIFGTEVGNFAMKTLPYGGIYLTGGVTMGLAQYLQQTNVFKQEVYAKGRLSATVRRFPIYVLQPEIEIGILGAEEQAYRLQGCFGISADQE